MKTIQRIWNFFPKNCLLFLLFSLFVSINISLIVPQHFTQLAEAFLNGRFYFSILPADDWTDTVLFNSKHFWPLGPLPAVVLMPFVFVAQKFGFLFSQAYLNIVFVLMTGYLIFKLAIHYQFTRVESWWWMLSFLICSPLLAVALVPNSWWFSQSLATLLLFLFLWEFVNKKRLLILGLISGALLATRLTAGISVISLTLMFLLLETVSWRKKVSKLWPYLIPIVSTTIFLSLYNFLRFNNIWETGYNLQLLGESLIKARSYGIFSLTHLPGNLYYAFLATPLPIFRDDLSHVLKFPYLVPDHWGMSLFITSPYLLYLFTFKYKDLLSKILLVSSLISALVIFTYYGIGVNQVGYRYALDFLPLIFILLLLKYKEKYGQLSLAFKTLIVVFSIINMYLFIVFLFYR